jgi:hypothetical protein
MIPPHIIVATGSRRATDESLITGALSVLYHLHPGARLYVGDAPGADRLLTVTWAHLHERRTVAVARADGLIRRFDADWTAPCDPVTCQPGHRRTRADDTGYCPAAGPRRNDLMCTCAAEVSRDHGISVTTLAVYKLGELNHGTADCVNAMRRHGLPAPVNLMEAPVQGNDIPSK